MGLMSTNPFPSMLYVEQGSTPASPSSGDVRLFVRSSDHVLCLVNSAGVVTALSGSLTNPMSHVGAVIIGGSAGAPTELVIGGAGGALSSLNGTAAYNSGTSFPGSKATGDRYWRTDLGMEAYWDGTRWLTPLMSLSFPMTEHLNNQGATAVNLGRLPVPYQGVYGFYAVALDFFWVGSIYSSSVYWTIKLNAADASDSDTLVGSTMDTKLGIATNNYNVREDINAVVSTNAREFKLRADPVSSPGQFTYTSAVLTYRLILT